MGGSIQITKGLTMERCCGAVSAEEKLLYFHDRYIPVTESGCWLWIGTYSSKGYGWATFSRKMIKAHRLAFELFVGPIPDGKLVLHRCDVRCCVNPNHLFIGTAQDNSDDAVRKGRIRSGADAHLSKLSYESVVSVCQLHAEGVRPVDIAERFGVHPSCIYHIISGRSWRSTRLRFERKEA